MTQNCLSNLAKSAPPKPKVERSCDSLACYGHFGNQAGASAWTLLPWLLFTVLAAIFWWYVQIRQTPIETRIQQDIASLSTDNQVIEAPTASIISAPAKPVSSYHDAVVKASPSVVNIYTTQHLSQHPYMNDPQFRRFLEEYGMSVPQSNQNSLGSGVVVSADGYIVTNAHVIKNADEIIVAFHDGKKATATVVGTDPESDLAVIRTDATNLTPLAIRTTAVNVGDVVLAIGNPFGVGQTVTQGIISATGRTGLGVMTYEDYIQTDAAINPGNSGGALVDANGDLIGINTVIYSRTGGSIGIGFAIPTSIVEKVMNDIITSGKVSRGWLGIEVARVPTDAANLTLEHSDGVVVTGIQAGGPAASAGLKVGDVITHINNLPMNDANALIQYISMQAPTSKLNLDIKRGGNAQSIQVTLAERPAQTTLAVR